MAGNSNPVDVTREEPSGRATLASHGRDLLQSLRQETGRLFDTHLFASNQGHGWRLPFGQPELKLSRTSDVLRGPAVEVVERDHVFEITAELPGLRRDNVDIRVSDGVPTLKGEKKAEREDKAKGRYPSERRCERFERVFRALEDVDATRIEASFDTGVPKGVLPKKPGAQRQMHKVDIDEIRIK